MPIPPYTIHFQPSSSGTVLAGQHLSPAHSGTSGVHVGSYDLVLSTYQSLGGPNRIFSQRGQPMSRASMAPPSQGFIPQRHSTLGPPHLTCSRHRYLSWGMTRSHPLARLIPRLIVRSCPIDSTLTTHPRHTPRSPQLLPHYHHQVP